MLSKRALIVGATFTISGVGRGVDRSGHCRRPRGSVGQLASWWRCKWPRTTRLRLSPASLAICHASAEDRFFQGNPITSRASTTCPMSGPTRPEGRWRRLRARHQQRRTVIANSVAQEQAIGNVSISPSCPPARLRPSPRAVQVGRPGREHPARRVRPGQRRGPASPGSQRSVAPAMRATAVRPSMSTLRPARSCAPGARRERHRQLRLQRQCGFPAHPHGWQRPSAVRLGHQQHALQNATATSRSPARMICGATATRTNRETVASTRLFAR
jgi:hypothetical protein